jgi:glycosyltransferase involved in cell wall biosynthesis
MNLDDITPLILTFNEAPNIGDTLERLRWAKRVVVVDSFSSDATIEIAESFDNVAVVQRRFDDHVSQWNLGLGQIETVWVLTLDADYRCPPALAEEIRGLDGDCDAYVAAFTYCVDGKPLRGTLYPPRAVLFRPKRCRYVQDGHTQRLIHDPRRTRELSTKLLHDDRKPLADWLVAQTKYQELNVDKLLDTPWSQLGWSDRLRRWYVVIPVLTFFYCLFVKRLILDGRAGCYYTLQRVYAEMLMSLTLLDRRLRPATEARGELIAKTAADVPHRPAAETYELSHPGN